MDVVLGAAALALAAWVVGGLVVIGGMVYILLHIGPKPRDRAEEPSGAGDTSPGER